MIARNKSSLTALLVSAAILAPAPGFGAAPPEMKQDAIANVESHAKQVQVMVDTVFSYAEPGFQEFRTGEYLTGILAKNGFKITKGVAGIPTAWTATWGDGGPLIALGSDEDDLRGVSQIPGDPKIEPLVDGAPGHGEGHNSGMPLMIAAALAVKAVMEKNHLKGRLMLWPGIAEELLGSKAFYVRDGVFKGVDACIFVHVASQFDTAYGDLGSNGMVSVEYTFHGKTAHAAGDPWDGHSALDAVEIMDVAWQLPPRASAAVATLSQCDLPTAAASPISCRVWLRSGIISASMTSSRCENCGTSATRSPMPPPWRPTPR